MTTNKRITIHDIAREAGVSPSTVSRVLNGTTPVAEDKRQAVNLAIQQLNYRPNPVAQGLARGTSTVIGVLTQDIASPFYSEILRGIDYGLRNTIYHPIFANGNWRKKDEQYALDVLHSRQPAGIIMLGGTLEDTIIKEFSQQLPLVMVGRLISGFEQQCVRVDDFQGGYMATKYLIDLGHHRIAHISGLLTHEDTHARQAGYEYALQEAGLAINPERIVEGTFLEQSGLMAVEALLMRGVPFTAIFAANDQMAYGARLALYKRGIRVPEDISLIGFDDLPSSAYTTPPLTTVRQPSVDMGIKATEVILALIEDQPLQITPFSPELIIRESVTLLRH